ncbi:MAG: hypothetical protein H6733_00205 [Alphaproteobacteria bacterium]|nr:hypothetical protein [Alphaproteobacteria bacterium]
MTRPQLALIAAGLVGVVLAALVLQPPDTSVTTPPAAPVAAPVTPAPGTLLPPPDPSATPQTTAPATPPPQADAGARRPPDAPAPAPEPSEAQAPPVEPAVPFDRQHTLDGEGAQAALDEALPALDACLASLSFPSPPYPGPLTATLHLVTEGGVGRVRKIDMSRPQPEDGGLLACLHRAMGTVAFRAPPRGKVDLTLPLDLHGR